MKLVIFDCDGTIVDSQHSIVAAMEAAFASADLPHPARTAIVGVVGLSLVPAVARLAPGLPHPAHIDLAERYKAQFQDIRRRDAGHEPLYPGAREAIESLARRGDTLLAVATGKSLRGLKAVLERECLIDCFATLQTADTHPSKPHPSMIHEAMAHAGAGPADTVMIGDTTFDMEMAGHAEVGAIGVAWGYHPVEALVDAGADVVIHDYAGLDAALQQAFGAPRRNPSARKS